MIVFVLLLLEILVVLLKVVVARVSSPTLWKMFNDWKKKAKKKQKTGEEKLQYKL